MKDKHAKKDPADEDDIFALGRETGMDWIRRLASAEELERLRSTLRQDRCCPTNESMFEPSEGSAWNPSIGPANIILGGERLLVKADDFWFTIADAVDRATIHHPAFARGFAEAAMSASDAAKAGR